MELSIFLIGMLVAASNAFVIRAIDMTLDYGHIFDGLRLRIFEKENPEIIRQAKAQLLDQPFSREVEIMNSAYWSIYEISRKKRLKRFLCIDCMNMRFNIYVSAFVFGYFSYELGILALLLLLVMIGVNQFVHLLISKIGL